MRDHGFVWKKSAAVATRVSAVFGLLCAASNAALAANDPPGFAPVVAKGTQVVALNVNCFEHQVGDYPPNPCRGELMFHDAAGSELKRGSYDLQPGESMSFRLAIPATNAAGERISRILIIPCIIPGEGRAVPSAEVFDREAGRVVHFAHPAAARMSEFDDGSEAVPDAGAMSSVSDPPVFGPATLRSGQVMRMNVTCFNHDVVGWPPNPCAGEVMFHDASGNVLRRASYSLEPGQSRSFGVAPPMTRTGLATIIPCVIPDPGGRVVPGVEVTDGAGGVALQINPAAARASQFEDLTPRMDGIQ